MILSLFLYLFPIIVLICAYYFGIFLPSKLENDERIFLRYSLKVGDKIVIDSGLIGTVVQKNKTTVVVSLYDGSLAEVLLESVCKKFE